MSEIDQSGNSAKEPSRAAGYSSSNGASTPIAIFEGQERRTIASYQRALKMLRRAEIKLKEQMVLSQESDHRLLNGLQMVVSLLSLQSRASANAEVATQLAAAADRIAGIGRIHQRLHSLDGVQTFAIKQHLDDICRDFSIILSANRPERVITVVGNEINLPAVTGVPLGFIINELLTNAVKYGTGRITVSVRPDPEKSYTLSVSNDGPSLPKDFNPAQSKGLGMRIIRSLVKQIGGELRIGRGDMNEGVRFTVLFS
jgi:two-component sensor histidine kinase